MATQRREAPINGSDGGRSGHSTDASNSEHGDNSGNESTEEIESTRRAGTMLERNVSTVVGLGVLFLAVLVVVSPKAKEFVPTDELLKILGNDYLLIGVIAAFGAVALVGILSVRLLTGVQEANPSSVERATADAPGRAFDTALESLPPIRVTDRHQHLHERLREAAIRVISEQDDCTKERADELIEAGIWTEDTEVATFLSNREPDPPPLQHRFQESVRGTNWYRERVRLTVSALENRQGDRT